MPRYTFRANARKVGAIGVFESGAILTVDAPNENTAVELLYNQWDFFLTPSLLRVEQRCFTCEAHSLSDLMVSDDSGRVYCSRVCRSGADRLRERSGY